MEIKGCKINFLGDSITEGVGVSSVEHRYTDVFARKNGVAVMRNYGISGTRIAKQIHPTEANPSWDRDFCSRVDEMDPDADIVVVFGGINDFGHGDAPFGEKTDRTASTFCGACHELMRLLVEKYPTALVVFMTPLHSTVEEKPGKHPLSDYVDQIIRAAGDYAIPVLDLYRKSGLAPKVPILKKTYLPDSTHPNDAGAERIADRLAAFIRSI